MLQHTCHYFLIPLFFVAYSILYSLDLHSYHRQNVHRDPVEFIKATPHSCLSQALIDVTYRLEDEMLWLNGGININNNIKKKRINVTLTGTRRNICAVQVTL